MILISKELLYSKAWSQLSNRILYQSGSNFILLQLPDHLCRLEFFLRGFCFHTFCPLESSSWEMMSSSPNTKHVFLQAVVFTHITKQKFQHQHLVPVQIGDSSLNITFIHSPWLLFLSPLKPSVFPVWEFLWAFSVCKSPFPLGDFLQFSHRPWLHFLPICSSSVSLCIFSFQTMLL